MSNLSNLTAAEAAEYLRTSQRTLIRWRNARTGPAWAKVGGKVLYRRAALDDYLDAHTVQTAADRKQVAA